jgi:hypothetical protein
MLQARGTNTIINTTYKLSIKAGRWQNIDKVPRFCNLYNKQQIGDTHHYISE